MDQVSLSDTRPLPPRASERVIGIALPTARGFGGLEDGEGRQSNNLNGNEPEPPQGYLLTGCWRPQFFVGLVHDFDFTMDVLLLEHRFL